MQIKRHWLGHHWYLPGAYGNDINKASTTYSVPPTMPLTLLLQTNVPNVRLKYRHDTLVEELALIGVVKPKTES
jgi:AMP deaminase